MALQLKRKGQRTIEIADDDAEEFASHLCSSIDATTDVMLDAGVLLRQLRAGEVLFVEAD